MATTLSPHDSVAARPQAAEWQVWTGLWIVYLVWGSTYLAIRVVVETVPPFLSAGGRFVLAGAAMLAFLAWRRGPRNVSTPEGVYASIGALARRFGFGQRPTETAFEYATALGDVLPGVRPELQTVAAAKVEVSYGRRELGEDRLTALTNAYQRLRVSLLRLAFRRGDRRRGTKR